MTAKLDRRQLLSGATGGALAAIFGPSARLAAAALTEETVTLGPRTPFSFDILKEMARRGCQDAV